MAVSSLLLFVSNILLLLEKVGHILPEKNTLTNALQNRWVLHVYTMNTCSLLWSMFVYNNNATEAMTKSVPSQQFSCSKLQGLNLIKFTNKCKFQCSQHIFV